MRPVVVYTRAYCGYCSRALELLRRKGVQVTEIDATSDPEKRQEMIQRSGRWTFPQIFVGDTHVGGCDDLHALERDGGLDPLLSGT
jgi:glutaredoxin 3